MIRNDKEMKRIGLYIIALLVVVTSVNAQVTMTLDEYNQMQNDKKVLDDSIVGLKDSINQLNQKIENYISEGKNKDKEIGRLNDCNDSLSKVNNRLKLKESNLQQVIANYKSDSLNLIKECDDKVAEMGKKVEDANRKVDHADTITIMMINTCLSLKRDSTAINGLIHQFDNISSRVLKENYNDLKEILRLYTSTREEIKQFAQKKISLKEFKKGLKPLQDKYKKELDKLDYVKKYYNNKKRTSPYLNEMLKKTYKAIDKSDSTILEEVLEM